MRRLVFLITAILLTAAGGSSLAATIAEARRLPDGTYVSLPQKVVTCSGPDFFYIEDDSRAAGIRVRRAGNTFTPGVRVNVNGYLATNLHSERYLTNC